MIAMAGYFKCETGIDILIESPSLHWGLVSGALPLKHLLVLSKVLKKKMSDCANSVCYRVFIKNAQHVWGQKR